MNRIYITGHRNPDLDSLCSASAYAVLKNTIDPENEYVAIRCSHVSDSVKKQMEYFGLEIPEYKKDIKPRVSDVMMKASKQLDINAPIHDLVQEYETTKPSVFPVFDKGEFAGLLSVDDIAAWFLNDKVKNEKVYDYPIGTMMKTKTETIDANELFTEARKQFTNSSARGFAVVDNDEFVGYVTRRCFLDMPMYDIIMVDHNEASQSIDGIELANIREIIDHHRLNALSTKLPIFIASEPLGSTCTIVYQLFKKHGITPDKQTAKYLLTGLISDTLILKSPTTTKSDEIAMTELAKLAGVADYHKYGEELFKITDNLGKQDPAKTILSDFKKYKDGGVKLGIGQCEVTTLSDVSEYADSYIEALEQVRNQNGLDWTMLMITDVLRDVSVLLVSDNKLNRELPYENMSKQIYKMPGVMSRKKQLLPTMLSIMTKG